MSNLTEKWKAGKLKRGYYYIKRKDGEVIVDPFEGYRYAWDDLSFTYQDDFITEVICPIPSYCELHRLKEENKELKRSLVKLSLFVKGLAPKNIKLSVEFVEKENETNKGGE